MFKKTKKIVDTLLTLWNSGFTHGNNKIQNMRTKTLLVAAAMLAAGLASSMAQSNVYSLNVVGYVNVVLPTGYAMIANPLNGTNNTIATVLPNVPPGTLLWKYSVGFGNAAESSGTVWDAPGTTLAPGEGAFIQVPGPATLTFVGEVLQGNLTNPVPANFSIRSSQVPQQGGLSSLLGFPTGAGDKVHLFDRATQQYKPEFESGGGTPTIWSPSEPSLEVGQAFWSEKLSAANWVRTFTVAP